MLLIRNRLVIQGLLAEARAAVLTFILYLRPSDTLSLHGKRLTPPPLAGPARSRLWSVGLRFQEDAISSKTGVFDERMLIDNPMYPWTGPMLATIKETSGLNSPLFPATYATWAKAFSDAAQLEQLQVLGTPFFTG